jgi:AcrR family transcriptional regulator
MADPHFRDPLPVRPRISRRYLDEHRRRRIVEAIAELLHEFGRYQLSITNIVRLAGTARNTFYEVFHSADDAISYGAGLATAELFAALEAQTGEGDWRAEVEAAIGGFYEAVVADPLLAELLLVHAASCKEEAGRSAHREAARRFVGLLGSGRAQAEAMGRAPLSDLAEELFSHSIVSLARRRVREPRLEALPGEARPLTGLIAGFYLGPTYAGPLPGTPAAGAPLS